MFNKRVISLFSVVVLMLSLCFSFTAYAEDIEISKCDVNDSICAALQEKYGADSAVLYSTTETTTCTNQLTISVDGEERIVYVSAKPASDDEVVAPPPVGNENPGTIPDDGIVIKPGDTGINEIELPKTSMDDILNWATTKGNEIIYVLQIFCQPFAIIIFIIAAFMTLIGCIGKSDMVGKGVWGMVLSVVVYAAVLYAPVILQSFVGWVAS